MSDGDLINLYSGRILALTTEIEGLGRLDAPHGSGTARSPQCGSTITVDVKMSNGQISHFAQDVRACALGQAAAAIMSKVLIGRSAAEVRRAHAELAQMLAGGPVPAAPFAEYEVLTAARDFKNRHASIQLALQAAVDAITQAEARHG